MKRFLFIYLILVLFFVVFVLIYRHLAEKTDSVPIRVELRYELNQSLTYPEVIAAYQALDRQHRKAKLLTYGPTDLGKPLHLFVISKSGIFNPDKLRSKGFRIILVNNGIHPGEPCGIDASIKLAQDILENKDGLWKLMDSTVLCIIPVYNVGGAHNRSQFNRANQNGPEEQGFRANAKNLDLNRDFAPMDSRNAQSFAQIFHHWKPHLLIDTHTTNGADYQYIITLIGTHSQGIPPMLGEFCDSKVEPYLYSAMEKSGYEMIPYVDPMGETPESGIQRYISSPRYTTGYGRVFNTITLMTEAHMFKSFSQRVLGTYEFIKTTIKFTDSLGYELQKVKAEANRFVADQKEFVLHWQLDSSKAETIPFKGYEAEFIDSRITGGKRLRYNTEKPFEKEIPFFRHYIPSLTILKPKYYIIPQAWHEVIHRLEINDVCMKRLDRDTLMEVDVYYIDDYKTLPRPYNGHYLHFDLKVRIERQTVQLYMGDYIVPTNQPCNEYIIQMLEPQAYDSFFTWNFFDASLQRKEYFSPYVFEDYAEEMLKNNDKLREEFETKRKNDKEFAANSYAQLNFLYQRSPYFEKSFMRYPVFRAIAN
jgi:hypothetical protein